MSRYESMVDPSDLNNSRAQLALMAGHEKRVLDVGCASGDTARVLVAQGCHVTGVDNDEAAVARARDVLDDLLIADIETTALSTQFPSGSFDVILFGDVLEHLRRPGEVLKDVVSLLAEGGRILVSIPNVTHASVRLALLQGRWRYTDTGLLDDTHVRFYNRDSVCRLIEDAGMSIQGLRGTIADPLGTEVEVDAHALPPAIVEWARRQPDALVYQFIVEAKPLADGEAAGRRPQLEPASPPDEVRLRDEHTRAAEQEQQARHELLLMRDHILGLEAQTASARARAGQAQAKAMRAERRARRLRQELDEVSGGQGTAPPLASGLRRRVAGLRGGKTSGSR